MPNVILKRYQNGPYIMAPEFCPYKLIDQKDWQDPCEIVHPTLCPLCRICTFVPSGGEEVQGLTACEQQEFAKYLTNGDQKVARSISGQQVYLSKEQRIPLVILISITLLERMLNSVIPAENRRRIAYNCVITSDQPLTHVLGCPVYFSRKLTRSEVQVCGEIEWR